MLFSLEQYPFTGFQHLQQMSVFKNLVTIQIYPWMITNTIQYTLWLLARLLQILSIFSWFAASMFMEPQLFVMLSIYNFTIFVFVPHVCCYWLLVLLLFGIHHMAFFAKMLGSFWSTWSFLNQCFFSCNYKQVTDFFELVNCILSFKFWWSNS